MPMEHITADGDVCGTYRYAPRHAREKWQCDGCGRTLGGESVPFL